MTALLEAGTGAPAIAEKVRGGAHLPLQQGTEVQQGTAGVAAGCRCWGAYLRVEGAGQRAWHGNHCRKGAGLRSRVAAIAGKVKSGAWLPLQEVQQGAQLLPQKDRLQ